MAKKVLTIRRRTLTISTRKAQNYYPAMKSLASKPLDRVKKSKMS